MPLNLFKDHNFNVTTVAGLIKGIAMSGALAHLPTYLQMVTGANATEAGFLMIPLMAALWSSPSSRGQLVSKFERYSGCPSPELCS